MSAKHLSRDPQRFKNCDSAWFYEERDGLKVVVEHPNGSKNNATVVTISWPRIRRALMRKDMR